MITEVAKLQALVLKLWFSATFEELWICCIDMRNNHRYHRNCRHVLSKIALCSNRQFVLKGDWKWLLQSKPPQQNARISIVFVCYPEWRPKFSNSLHFYARSLLVTCVIIVSGVICMVCYSAWKICATWTEPLWSSIAIFYCLEIWTDPTENVLKIRPRLHFSLKVHWWKQAILLRSGSLILRQTKR